MPAKLAKCERKNNGRCLIKRTTRRLVSGSSIWRSSRVIFSTRVGQNDLFLSLISSARLPVAAYHVATSGARFSSGSIVILESEVINSTSMNRLMQYTPIKVTWLHTPIKAGHAWRGATRRGGRFGFFRPSLGSICLNLDRDGPPCRPAPQCGSLPLRGDVPAANFGAHLERLEP